MPYSPNEALQTESLLNDFADLAALKQNRVLMEPAEEYTQRVRARNLELEKLDLIRVPIAKFDADAYSLAQYQTSFKSQQDRATCWAFAGVAALEAAYKRKYNLTLDLSEQYVFHMMKAGELYFDYATNTMNNHENNSSFWGFHGSSGIVEHMTRFAVPDELFAPYKNQSKLDAIRRGIPEAGSLDWNSTQEQLDAFEFSEQHIPIAARWNAKYRVKSWGALGNNPTPEAIEQVIRAGYEVVADVPGHCILIVGYDRKKRTFIVKNSWGENNFITISYDDNSGWKILGAHYITDVIDPNTPPQIKAKWLGRWNMDHDGWRGTLVIRRFTNFRNADKNAATKLGNYYRDGQRYDVNGYFLNDGQAIVFHIADHSGRIIPGTLSGQRFDTYSFSWDAFNAAGKTTWQNIPFGTILSRKAIPGVYSSSFSRDEWIGNWDMNHDGWRGTLSIKGFIPLPAPVFNLVTINASYTASDGKVCTVTGVLSNNSLHVLSLYIKFSSDNNQRFDLTYHTWEDKVFSGVTYWGNTTFGVQGFTQGSVKNDAPWESLGGILHSGPDACSWAPGRLDTFVRGADNALWHKYFENGWSDWESLGGYLTSDPSAVSWGNGRIDIFGRGADNALWHKYFENGWSDWESLGGYLTSGPDACSWAPGRLDLFVRGGDNALYHKYFENGWSDWESLGGSLTSDPSAVSWGNGRIDVFARGEDGALIHKYFENGWSDWETLDGSLNSSPDVCSWAPGRLDIFVRGEDNALWHKYFENGWSGWEFIDGILTSDPSAVSWGNGRIDIFMRGANSAMYHKWYEEGWKP